MQNIKCVQKLADEQNMNTKKNWSVTFGDFFILPPNGHFIPQVKGAARGEFVDTEIKAEEINDQVVIYIFRVWLKEYSIAKKEHYNPRPICYILIYKNIGLKESGDNKTAFSKSIVKKKKKKKR